MVEIKEHTMGYFMAINKENITDCFKKMLNKIYEYQKNIKC